MNKKRRQIKKIQQEINGNNLAVCIIICGIIILEIVIYAIRHI